MAQEEPATREYLLQLLLVYARVNEHAVVHETLVGVYQLGCIGDGHVIPPCVQDQVGVPEASISPAFLPARPSVKQTCRNPSVSFRPPPVIPAKAGPHVTRTHPPHAIFLLTCPDNSSIIALLSAQGTFRRTQDSRTPAGHPSFFWTGP